MMMAPSHLRLSLMYLLNPMSPSLRLSQILRGFKLTAIVTMEMSMMARQLPKIDMLTRYVIFVRQF